MMVELKVWGGVLLLSWYTGAADEAKITHCAAMYDLK